MLTKWKEIVRERSVVIYHLNNVYNDREKKPQAEKTE